MKRFCKNFVWPTDRNIIILIFYQQVVNVFTTNSWKRKTISNIYEQSSLTYFLQLLVFYSHLEELQTVLFEAELIINNAPLTL